MKSGETTRLLFVAMFSLVLSHRALAQEPSPEAPVNRELIDAALKLTKDASAQYAFELEDDAHTQAKQLPEPILRWSNPAVGEVHGNVFLWTVNERPAVVSSLFKWFTPHTHMSHEFHSLSESPVVGRREGAEVWRTHEPGVRFSPLSDAPAPASTAAQRLLQMRRLSRDFSATKKERDGSQQELRLLAQPIYRYAAPHDQVQDGGLFVFVQGTDPDVFVLIEARGAADAAQWQFAPVRMNGVGFSLRHHDREVWSVEVMPWRDIYSHAQTYTTFQFQNVAIPAADKGTP